MHVRIFPYECQFKGLQHLTEPEFLSDIRGRVAEFSFQGQRRLLRLHATGGYVVAVLISVRDEQRLCTLQRAGQNLVVTVHELGQNIQLMDFNFFLLHPATWRGIYQYYRGSYSITNFCKLLAHLFQQYRETRVAQMTQNLQARCADSTARNQAGSYYRGKFLAYRLLSRRGFQDLLRDLAFVRSFEYEYAVYDDEREPWVRPVANLVKTRRQVFRFCRNEPERVIQAIAEMVRTGDLRFGHVMGQDADGYEANLKLANNVDCLADRDFDRVTDDLRFPDLDHFYECPVVEELLAVARAHSDLLGAQPE